MISTPGTRSNQLGLKTWIEQIFYRITAADRKLISAEHVFVGSTHVKANANKRKFEKKIVRKETRAYQGRLQNEINQDRKHLTIKVKCSLAS